MDELIKLFNNEMTHIEIDTVNQRDNGEDHDFYSYTVILLDNKTLEVIDNVSIDNFDREDIEWVKRFFIPQLEYLEYKKGI